MSCENVGIVAQINREKSPKSGHPILGTDDALIYLVQDRPRVLITDGQIRTPAGSPQFKKGSIDIGNGQRGRERATSVIHCEPETEEILSAIRHLYSSIFQETLGETQNPYRKEGASEANLEQIERVNLDGSIRKAFVNSNDSRRPST
jgi:hypothetical protein